MGETRRRGLRIIEREFCQPVRVELRCDLARGGEGLFARWQEARREGLITPKVELLLGLIHSLG